MTEKQGAMIKKACPPGTVISKVLCEAKLTFVHKSSLMWIGIIGLLFGIRSSVGILEVNAHEAGSSIFQVAGTMVALILPAAAMANTFVSKLSDDHFSLIDRQEVPPEKKRALLNKVASETKEYLSPAWRASVYVLCSFLLSIIAMTLKPICTPGFSIHTRLFSAVCDLSIDSLVLGVSIGFLVIGSLWFFPVIWFAFSLESLKAVFDAIDFKYPTTSTNVDDSGQTSSPLIDSTGQPQKKNPVA